MKRRIGQNSQDLLDGEFSSILAAWTSRCILSRQDLNGSMSQTSVSSLELVNFSATNRSEARTYLRLGNPWRYSKLIIFVLAYLPDDPLRRELRGI
jgi:hypothetical protein